MKAALLPALLVAVIAAPYAEQPGGAGSQPAAARPPLALPWAPNRSIFPSFWFGQNAAAFDSADYLRDVVGRHALAIYGWSHASRATPPYSGEERKLSRQCAALKAVGAGTRCAVYRQGWLAMSNYNAQVGISRIVALYYRSSTSYQNR